MSLPKTKHPIFEMTIPSTKKKVSHRPFLSSEEKLLLIAQQSEDDRDIIRAIKQVLQLCVIDPDFDVDKLATFDLEYMFLKLRAKSVNNIIDVSYRDSEDDKVYDFKIDLDEVEINYPEISHKIKLTDGIGVCMKYPSITLIDSIPDGLDEVGIAEYLVRQCIDYVYDEENVYPLSEESDDEINEFLGSLSIENYDKIEQFFDSLPTMRHEIDYVNSNGSERKIILSSLRDFFTWG